MAEPSKSRVYDIAIIGGALAGASMAVLLLRRQPGLRVLVLEKSAAFGRRVGEATVEVSGYFLGRVLGLTDHLNHAHLLKQGMRFWFYNQSAATIPDCTEIGGRYLSRVPSYQVDRAVLDEEVLRLAASSGAEVWRPASVGTVTLSSGGAQLLQVRHQERRETVSARWVVDASGVAALLARQEGWFRPNLAHPTSAVWARWTGVQGWDSVELAAKYPQWAAACHGIRGTATNHFVGPGWWAWCIPLKGGDFSIGVVFDERLVKWPEHGTVAARLKDFLAQHPVAREIMADAQFREGDVHWRRNLPYFTTTFAGDGFVLVGDAAGFIDPFYSPGMDWLSFTCTAGVELILAQQSGRPLESLIRSHNERFAQSYERWFEAVYRDKYEYMGEFELMRVAFLLDLGFYYLGVASQPYKYGPQTLASPVFSTRPSIPFYYLMRTYNRRFAKMGASRRARGTWGRTNAGHRLLIPGFSFAPSSSISVLKALAGWARLEITEGWRTWFVSPHNEETKCRTLADHHA